MGEIVQWGKVLVLHTVDRVQFPQSPQEWSLIAELRVVPEHDQMWTKTKKNIFMWLFIEKLVSIVKKGATTQLSLANE